MKTKLLIVSGLIVFAVVECALFLYVDRDLSEYLRLVDLHHRALIDIFRAYTDFGKSQWYLWPTGLGVAFCALTIRFPSVEPRARPKLAMVGREFLFIFACVALAGLITDAIKPFIARARPIEVIRENIYGFDPVNFHAAWNSMPSGHSTTAASLAGALIVLFPRFRVVWIISALALMASRVMVNAHYLSDVLAGAFVGTGTVMMLIRFFSSPRINPITRWLFPIDTKLQRY